MQTDSNSASPLGLARLAGRKILVVDNSSTVRIKMKSILDEYGVSSLFAVDGQDGLNKINENKDIALVFCDLNMPIMDGLTMVEKLIESHGGNKESVPPIILVTTESSMKMVKRAKSLGVKGWIVKPVSKELIQEIIEKMTF